MLLVLVPPIRREWCANKGLALMGPMAISRSQTFLKLLCSILNIHGEVSLYVEYCIKPHNYAKNRLAFPSKHSHVITQVENVMVVPQA